MKLGIQTLRAFMEHVDHDMTVSKLYKSAAEAGFDALSVCSLEVERCGLTQIISAVKESGLELSSYLCFTPLYTQNNNILRAAIQTAIEELENCRQLKCQMMMLVPIVGTDPAGVPLKASPDWDRDSMQRRMIHALNMILPEARKCNIAVGIEDDPHIDVPQSSKEELDRLFRETDGLGLIFDTANMLVVGEDPLCYLEHFKSKIIGAHLKDAILEDSSDGMGDITYDGKHFTMVRHGHGIVDIPNIINRLRELHIPYAEYESDVSMELWHEDAVFLKSILNN